MTPEQDDDALKARLDKLGRDLKSAKPPRPEGEPGEGARDSAGAAWTLGMQAAIELVVSVGLGTAIGWGLDKLLHTKPAFTIVFFLLGGAAGVWGVIRATSPKGRQ